MGVDLLQYKTCNLDCVYCELGKTICLEQSRSRFVRSERVLSEIRAKCNDDFDYLTFAGSGEPTLSIDLGEIIQSAKKLVDAPVAVITNSVLLTNQQVRQEVALADVVLPSLDAVTQKTFCAINRPAPGLMIKDVIEGLIDFRKEFDGEIWLEVMLVRDINDSEAELISKAVDSIQPDRIQINTIVRRPAELVMPLKEEDMLNMLEIFPGAEVIPDWDWRVPHEIKAEIIRVLTRKSYTLEELEALLELRRNDVIKYLSILERDKSLSRQLRNGKLCFQAPKKNANNLKQSHN
jgi:wyosine [tRNA(Phe)-imidazoG37] synthetase (radical SAM superfamily)